MRLQDALRKIVSDRVAGALRDSRLVSFLSDLEAFADYPEMRQVMAVIAEKGYGSELFRISRDGNLSKTVSYAQSLAKSLPKDFGISEEYARFASDSIVFAFGLAVTVKEPSKHMADLMRNSSPDPQKEAAAGGRDGTGNGAGQDNTGSKSGEPGSSRSGNRDPGASSGSEGTAGEGVERICPGCGARLPGFCLYCPECGKNVAPPGNAGGESGAAGASGGRRYGLWSPCGFLSPCGRMARSEWWIRWILLVTFFSACAWLYDTMTADSEPVDPHTLSFAVLFSVVSLTGLSAFFLSVRRLHDLGFSGWWAFLLTVIYILMQPSGSDEPGVLSLAGDTLTAVFLLCLSLVRGTRGPNRFGPDPLK